MSGWLDPTSARRRHLGHDHGPSGGHAHDHDDERDDVEVREPETLDPANRSLSDALLLSFRILKVAMFFLVLAFLGSGVFIVEPDEQAIVMRFGKVLPEARGPGLHFSLPYPVDEVIRVPVKQKKTINLDSFWFQVNPKDEGKDLDLLSPSGEGLNPAVDGALITGDRNLMHVRFQVTYRIEDPLDYVLHIVETEAEEQVRAAVESSTIAVVAGQEADEILRGQVTPITESVLARAQARLDELKTGIQLELLSVRLKSPPLATRDAFAEVQRAENEMLQTVEVARGRKAELLNRATGPAHEAILAKIAEYEAAHDKKEDATAQAHLEELGTLLMTQASGQAADIIQNALAYRENVLQQLQGELRRFEELLPEYRKNPSFLASMLWQETRRAILGNLKIEKTYVPPEAHEVRVMLNRNQKGLKAVEEAAIKKQFGGEE
jgi:membrane protease subunit HflK